MKPGLDSGPKGRAAERAKGLGPDRLRTARPAAASAANPPQGLGNQAIQQMLKTGVLHAKLAVASADDPLEREADRVADQALRAPTPVGGRLDAPRVSRKCEQCDDETLRQEADPAGASLSEAPPSVEETLGAPGQPLDPATRADFEQRFGRDFTGVRVHTDARAVQSAREVNAHAFTVGRDIAFDAGRFAPQSHEGRKLLAHELAHVVQRGLADGSPRLVQREPNGGGAKAAVPVRPAKIIPGSTHLSRLVQAYYVDHPGLSRSTNVIAFSYSVEGGPPQEEVVENQGGVHTEAWMDERLRQIRQQARRPVTLIEVYSERQPCGPSESDCEGMLGKRYPSAKVTFGYGYQETQSPGPESRARRSKDELASARARVGQSKQLEWDFQNPKGNPPPHFERDDPGAISRAPRRTYSRWGSKAQTADAAKAMVELEQSAARADRFMGRIQGYMQALSLIQSFVSYLDVFTDAMDLLAGGTIMGEQQKAADLDRIAEQRGAARRSGHGAPQSVPRSVVHGDVGDARPGHGHSDGDRRAADPDAPLPGRQRQGHEWSLR